MLLKSGKHVFTTDDLAVLWRLTNRRQLIERIKYYVRSGRLKPIYKGIYGYGEYGPLELAQKLVPMSYISLYTAAQAHGLSFQYYESIFCMSLKSKLYNIDGQEFVYHKLKEVVFYNSLGLIDTGQYTVAGKERTICDTLYVYPGASFDHLDGVDMALLREVSKIYENKRLEKAVGAIIKAAERDRQADAPRTKA